VTDLADVRIDGHLGEGGLLVGRAGRAEVDGPSSIGCGLDLPGALVDDLADDAGCRRVVGMIRRFVRVERHRLPAVD